MKRRVLATSRTFNSLMLIRAETLIAQSKTNSLTRILPALSNMIIRIRGTTQRTMKSLRSLSFQLKSPTPNLTSDAGLMTRKSKMQVAPRRKTSSTQSLSDKCFKTLAARKRKARNFKPRLSRLSALKRTVRATKMFA